MPPNNLLFEQISPDGTLTRQGATIYAGTYKIQPPIVISPNGTYVLLGSGDIYRSDALTWYRSLPNSFVAAIWDNDGNIVTAREVDGATRIDRYDANQAFVSETDYPDKPLALVSSASGYLLVGYDGHKPTFTAVPR